MFGAGVITFRETLEAAMVVGIILSFLSKTNQNIFKKNVWQGVIIGIFLSILLAFFLNTFFGKLEGRAEEIYEGILMFITASFLTWMILWVHRQKEKVEKLKEKISQHAKEGYGFGITVLTAISVFREGTESVMYLKAISLSGGGNMVGAVIGLIVALVLGFIMFKWALQFKLSTVFNITGVFLLLFAAGLVTHGVHEFQEAGILPVFFIDPVINISGVLNHKEGIGSFLRVLFGYTSKPTVIEIFAYATYIYLIFLLEKITDRMITKKAV